MSFQDIKYRAISWYAFPLLFILLLWNNDKFEIVDLGLNITFLIVNYLVVTLVFSIKEKTVINIFYKYIGIGDLLMLVCLGVWFPFFNFFAFYFLSLLLVIIGASMYIFTHRSKHFTVPLAGLQSAMLSILVIFNWVTGTALNHTPLFEKYLFYEGN